MVIQEAERAAAAATSPLLYPEVDPHFVVEERTLRLLTSTLALSARRPRNLKLRGKQGTGKGTLVRQLAARAKRPHFKADFGVLETPQELFGIRDVIRGDTVFTPGGFLVACETPGAVILLDELNRCHPSLLGLLYPLLDDSRATWVAHLGRWVTVAPGVIFGAAFNVGAEFSGTHRLDAALSSRLTTTIELGWLPADREAGVLIGRARVDPVVATKMIEFAGQLRASCDLPAGGQGRLSHAPGLRELLEAADHVALGGLSPGEALEATVLPDYAGAERDAAHLILQGLFGGQPQPAPVRARASDPEDLDDVPFKATRSTPLVTGVTVTYQRKV